MSEIASAATKRRRDAEDLNKLLLSELRHEYQSLSGILERIAGYVYNHVVLTLTDTIGADGYYPVNYHIPSGSVVLFNQGANSMTFVGGSGGGNVAPSKGQGVHPVRSHFWAGVPFNGAAFTIYGTAGDVFTVHVLTSLMCGGGAC